MGQYMNIVADENVPFIREAFGTLGDVEVLPGRAIGPEQVREAALLIVRSVTPVGPALLEKSRVRFVGSATYRTRLEFGHTLVVVPSGCGTLGETLRRVGFTVEVREL